MRNILIFILGIAIIFSIGYYITKATCDAKTVDIGYAHRFSLLGGCQVETEPGHWIPLENYFYPQQ